MFSKVCFQYAQCSVGVVYSMHNVQQGFFSVCTMFSKDCLQYTMFSRVCLQYAQCSVGFVFRMHNVQQGLFSVCTMFSKDCLQ